MNGKVALVLLLVCFAVVAQSASISFFNEDDSTHYGAAIKNPIACEKRILKYVMAVCKSSHNCPRDFIQTACSTVVDEDFVRSSCCPVV